MLRWVRLHCTDEGQKPETSTWMSAVCQDEQTFIPFVHKTCIHLDVCSLPVIPFAHETCRLSNIWCCIIHVCMFVYVCARVCACAHVCAWMHISMYFLVCVPYFTQGSLTLSSCAVHLVIYRQSLFTPFSIFLLTGI